MMLEVCSQQPRPAVLERLLQGNQVSLTKTHSLQKALDPAYQNRVKLQGHPRDWWGLRATYPEQWLLRVTHGPPA